MSLEDESKLQIHLKAQIEKEKRKGRPDFARIATFEREREVSEQRIAALQGRGKGRPEPAGKRQPKGFEGLGPKKRDLSEYLDGAGLTSVQRDCVSLILEHGLPLAEIARRLGRHHSTVQYHVEQAKKKIDHSREYQGRAKRRARAGVE